MVTDTYLNSNLPALCSFPLYLDLCVLSLDLLAVGKQTFQNIRDSILNRLTIASQKIHKLNNFYFFFCKKLALSAVRLSPSKLGDMYCDISQSSRGFCWNHSRFSHKNLAGAPTADHWFSVFSLGCCFWVFTNVTFVIHGCCAEKLWEEALKLFF